MDDNDRPIRIHWPRIQIIYNSWMFVDCFRHKPVWIRIRFNPREKSPVACLPFESGWLIWRYRHWVRLIPMRLIWIRTQKGKQEKTDNLTTDLNISNELAKLEVIWSVYQDKEICLDAPHLHSCDWKKIYTHLSIVFKKTTFAITFVELQITNTDINNWIILSSARS